MRLNFSEEQPVTRFLTTKGINKFRLSWKKNQLIGNYEDTNEIGYDI